ncbi:hypothetical protein ACOSP7_029268 [Xanthoceras sorbifolium]
MVKWPSVRRRSEAESSSAVEGILELLGSRVCLQLIIAVNGDCEEDYPFAVDGLEIWSAIKKWVEDYCCFYYKSDEMAQKDAELQSWWKELREEGHGDKKDSPAVNFGQYPYAGYLPNRPTMSRRFMPEKGTPEHSTDEVYIGQRDASQWTVDHEPLQTFEEFGNKMAKIEENILAMNKDTKLKNRIGPAKIPTH